MHIDASVQRSEAEIAKTERWALHVLVSDPVMLGSAVSLASNTA